jgi:hypothetical protein
LKHVVVRPFFNIFFHFSYSEWDERGEGQIANSSEDQKQLTVCTTTTRRFLCDVHRPSTGRGDSSAAATADVGGDGGDLNASPPAADGDTDKLSGEEGGRRELGAISKTGKR